MRKRLGLSAIVLAAIPFFLWGCGGDGGDSEPAPISKAVFVRKANAVCEKASEKILNEGSTAAAEGGGSGAQAGADLVPVVLVPGVEEEIEEVRALGMPKGDEAQVDAILNTLQEVMDKAKADPEKFLQDLGKGLRPYQKVEKLANGYGIPKCAQP